MNIDINCPHFDFCSGCSRNKNIDHLASLKEAQAFFQERGLGHVKLQSGSPIGWRCRAKLAVRGTSQNPLIGLFEEGSHQVVNIPECRVHHPAINQAVEKLKEWISTNQISLYDEKKHTGMLRYIQLAVERATGKVQLVLVINEKEEGWSHQDSLNKLWDKSPNLWHSLWLNFNVRKDNVIFSPRWRLLHGEKWLWERLCGKKICFHPGSFAQANMEMFEKMLVEIQTWQLPQTNLLELYSGVGAIGLSLADCCQKICFVEIAPHTKECFEESVKLLIPETAAKLTFIAGSSNAQKSLLNQNWNIVLVDPPRKGLEQGFIEDISVANKVERLIYVSCGWDSFKRDSAKLLMSGWRLKHAAAYLFFPGSEHIETLAIFDKA